MSLMRKPTGEASPPRQTVVGSLLHCDDMFQSKCQIIGIYSAGIKLIINRMAPGRVSVPNDDDTAGERASAALGVFLPRPTWARQPLRNPASHVPHTYSPELGAAFRHRRAL